MNPLNNFLRPKTIVMMISVTSMMQRALLLLLETITKVMIKTNSVIGVTTIASQSKKIKRPSQRINKVIMMGSEISETMMPKQAKMVRPKIRSSLITVMNLETLVISMNHKHSQLLHKAMLMKSKSQKKRKCPVIVMTLVTLMSHLQRLQLKQLSKRKKMDQTMVMTLVTLATSMSHPQLIQLRQLSKRKKMDQMMVMILVTLATSMSHLLQPLFR